MNENQEREAFEAWAKTYSTLSLERDAHGHYVSMEQELLWHGFQAGKAEAPVGASEGGDLDANARLGLAGADSACAHEFALSPTSSIQLCVKCGIGETAANKQARAALAAKLPSDPCLVLWQAMNEAEKVGNRTDDKLVVEFLRRAGYCITPAPAPDAEDWKPPSFRSAYLKAGKDLTPSHELIEEFKAAYFAWNGSPHENGPRVRYQVAHAALYEALAATPAQAQQAEPVTVEMLRAGAAEWVKHGEDAGRYPLAQGFDSPGCCPSQRIEYSRATHVYRAMRAASKQAAQAKAEPLTRQQIDKIMTKHYPLDSLLRENVDAFEVCVRDIEAAIAATTKEAK